jgi:hypothetical protein
MIDSPSLFQVRTPLAFRAAGPAADATYFQLATFQESVQLSAISG